MDFLIGPLLTMGGLGVVFGIALGFVEKIFYVKGDPVVEQIMEALPGANCGGCGFAGCGAYAEAVAAGTAKTTACSVGGAPVAAQIADAMGVEAGDVVKNIAFIKCAGSCGKAKSKYDYSGLSDCTAATFLAGGGAKDCAYGCLGLGSCQKACAFDAINIKDGLAVVDSAKCVACGACVKACPKDLIDLVPYTDKTKVMCNSKDKGKEVKAKCEVGCIACKMCVKACKFDAIIFEDNLARVDYDKCVNCGECVIKCPMNTIKGSDAVKA